MTKSVKKAHFPHSATDVRVALALLRGYSSGSSISEATGLSERSVQRSLRRGTDAGDLKAVELRHGAESRRLYCVPDPNALYRIVRDLGVRFGLATGPTTTTTHTG